MPCALAELFVEGLDVVCIIGDLERERQEPQRITLQLKARLAKSRVSFSDLLTDSVDYVAMADLATTIAQEGRFRLVEKLAASIAEGILAKWSLIEQVEVQIRKFACHPKAQACGIRYTASRG